MQQAETLEGFYLQHSTYIPQTLHRGIGHFNVFRRENFPSCQENSTTYSRKNYYKIALVVGKNRVHYADEIIAIKQQALVFTNPQTPFSYEPLGEDQYGFFCLFDESFFSQFGHIADYPVFQPGSSPVFELNQEQARDIAHLFEKMLTEIESDYPYKQDMLRTLTFELIHYALKLQPTEVSNHTGSMAYTRVVSVFMELLRSQFPIEAIGQRITLRTPAQYADQLAVHVNYLNRVLKEMTGKTTSQLIADRVAQEARSLLRHTDWTTSEIAWSLGFEELPHFIKFFKKQVQLTPKSYRTLEVV